jgi:hypothetical protein
MAKLQRGGRELEPFDLHADLDDSIDHRSRLQLLRDVIAHRTEVARGHTERLRLAQSRLGLAKTTIMSLLVILVIAIAYLTGTDPTIIIKELLAGVK